MKAFHQTILKSAEINSIKARAFEAKLLDDALNAIPLGHPVEADFYRTSSFGVRKDPFTRRPALHQAVDIASRHMAPVVSTADGTVIYTGTKGGYGKVVIVDHGHGFTTKYAHLAKTYVKRGQKVKKVIKLVVWDRQAVVQQHTYIMKIHSRATFMTLTNF